MRSTRIACLLGLLALSVSGCKPEITGETYFCGPEGLCPPNLSCQFGDHEDFAYNCVNELSADDFSCPEVTSDREPDNLAAEALDVGVLTCGSQFAFADWGCIDQGTDVDHFLLTRASVCVGSDPHFKASLRYPVGSAPLSLVLLDAAGESVAQGELCTPDFDTSGTELRCIESRDLPVGDYTLRVELDPQANADCDGACRYNHYQLFISSPVSS